MSLNSHIGMLHYKEFKIHTPFMLVEWLDDVIGVTGQAVIYCYNISVIYCVQCHMKLVLVCP